MDDLYGEVYEEGNFSANFEEVLSHMRKVDRKLRKLKKKKKGAKKHKKKDLKRRVKVLEMEQEQLKQFVIFMAYQNKAQLNSASNQQPWWQSALCSTLPKAFELATATINRLPAKTQPLCITDGSDRK